MRSTTLAVVLVLLWVAGAGATAPADADAQQSGLPAAVRPVDGPVVRPFEPPSHPYGPGHRGVDLAAEPGVPVRAALAGVVTFSGQVARRGWVTVDHGGGLVTTYGELDPRVVTPGQPVPTGGVLGHLALGATHVDWGARLHGEYIDPLRLLGRWRPHLVALPRPG